MNRNKFKRMSQFKVPVDASLERLRVIMFPERWIREKTIESLKVIYI